MYIDAFDFNHHPEAVLVNVATGKIISDPVNFEKSYEFGKNKVQEFESNLPGCYHNTLYHIIIKMDAAKKYIEAGRRF